MRSLSLLALALALAGCAAAPPSAPTTMPPSAPATEPDTEPDAAGPTTVAALCDALRPALAGRTAGLDRYAAPAVLDALRDWGDPNAEPFADERSMLCSYASGDAELRVAVERRAGGALYATQSADAVSGEYADPTVAVAGLWAHETDGTRIRILDGDDGYRYVRTYADGGAPVRGRVMLIDVCDGGTATLHGALLIDFGDRALCYRIDRLEPGRSMAYTLEESGTQWAWIWEAP